MIDTPAEPAVLLAVASTTQVQYIAITHNHMDHLLGFEEITKAIPAKVAIGEADAAQLPVPPDLSLRDGEDIQIGDLLIKSIRSNQKQHYGAGVCGSSCRVCHWVHRERSR